MFVSVLLPVRNEAPFIEETLRAVLVQDYPRELIEVIVADGMSEDGTREIVRELAVQDSRLRMVDNPKRITPAGLNLAIRAARGEVIVRVDGHSVIPQDYVRECVAFLTRAQAESPLRLDAPRPSDGRGIKGEGKGEGGESDATLAHRMGEGLGVRAAGEVSNSPNPDPKLNLDRAPPLRAVASPAGVGGAPSPDPLRHRTSEAPPSNLRPPSSDFCPPSSDLLMVGGAWDSVGRGWVGEAIAFAMSSKFGVGNSPYRILDGDASESPMPTDTVPFWAIKRETFERIGLFREEMPCHEDYEFNYRLRSAGGSIRLLPWLRAKYYVRSTLGGLARQYWRYGFWKGRFLCSYPGSLRARHLIPPLFVAALAALGSASFFVNAGRFWLGTLLVLYSGFLLVATASLVGSRRRIGGRADPTHNAFGLWPLLPVILATLHLCWGAGVWVGLLWGKVGGQPPSLNA